MNESERDNKFSLLAVNVPVMTQERFIDLTGVSAGVLRGWVERGHVPTVMVGKHRLINIIAMNLKLTNGVML